LLEVEAGNVAFAYLTLFADTDNVTPEMTELFRRNSDEINCKTFGTLLKRIKKHVTIDDNITAIIDEALEKRNYLTHHFFRSHNFAIHSAEGRRTMIKDIKECAKKFDLAYAVLGATCDGLHTIAGRPNFGVEESKKLKARGKRVKI
jgi:hypothetical protein